MAKKILVIDDDPLVGGTLLNLLKQSGHDVDVAISGEEGIDLIKEKPYDLVISDIRMPNLDGIRAMESIQEENEREGRECRYLFITGYEEGVSPRAMRLGIADGLMKPLEMPQFLEVVNQQPVEQI